MWVSSISPSLRHVSYRFGRFIVAATQHKREPQRRPQWPKSRIRLEKQERSPDRFFRKGRVSLGRHRYRKGSMAFGNLVFPHRFHVRRAFSFRRLRKPLVNANCTEIQGHRRVFRRIRLVRVPNRKLCSGAHKLAPPCFFFLCSISVCVAGSGTRPIMGNSGRHDVSHGRPASVMFSPQFRRRSFHRQAG